jgi:hypothetical protein
VSSYDYPRYYFLVRAEENHEKPVMKIFKLIFETRTPCTQNENTNYSTVTLDSIDGGGG